MIQTIKEWKFIQESKLVPRNIDERQRKLIQNNLNLLQQEVVEGNLTIDDRWNFLPEQVKVKQINGYVSIRRSLQLDVLPMWLKNVRINDNFDCLNNRIKTLENCPYRIDGTFDCSNNLLISLKGCPKYIGTFNCSDNRLITLMDGPNHVKCGFLCTYNQLTGLEGISKYIGGDLYLFHNKKKFDASDVPNDVKILGNLYS